MKSLKVKLHVDGETLRVPGLAAFAGKDVDVMVVESGNGSSIEALAQSRGVAPFDFAANQGGWPGDLDDDFESTVVRWRREDRVRDLPQ